jgi:hypothetical protein
MHLLITTGTPQHIPTATLPHTTVDIPAITVPATGALFVPHTVMVIAGDRLVRRREGRENVCGLFCAD